MVIRAGKITRIEVQQGNKNRFSIYLDDQYAFGIDTSVLLKCNLKKGLELSEAQIEQIILQEEKCLVRDKAYKLLSRRDHSRKELSDKLRQRGYSHELVEQVICEIQKAGYLDDAVFARRFASTRLQIRPMGKKRLLFELVRKGIEPEAAERAVFEAYAGSDELELARDVAIPSPGRRQRCPNLFL